MRRPARVKFIRNKTFKPLYETGLRKNKRYDTLWDDPFCDEIYKEKGVITVIDDDGQGHEIEKGDYEVKEWEVKNEKAYDEEF